MLLKIDLFNVRVYIYYVNVGKLAHLTSPNLSFLIRTISPSLSILILLINNLNQTISFFVFQNDISIRYFNISNKRIRRHFFDRNLKYFKIIYIFAFQNVKVSEDKLVHLW